MVNIMAFMEALKLTWIRRLLTEDCKWQIFIKQYLDIDKLTGCNIKYLEKVISELPNHFWKDVLQSLIKINKKSVYTDASILKSPIYYHHQIKVGGSHIYFKLWFDKGIKYINDLVNENGEFYHYNEFSMNTGINTNFLQYNGLINAIKQFLKTKNIKITHKEPSPFIPTNVMPVMKNSKGSKDMYSILNSNDNETPTGQTTWNKIYNLTKEQWKQIYIFPFKTTTYPALKWFQININHNILVTNKLLYQMKLNDDALCTFCQTTSESIIHLFWKCEKIQEFIRNVKSWLNSYHIQCDISEKYFLFGLQEEHRFTNVLNFCHTLCKILYLFS